MNVEIFCLCDAATDQAGRLNILGAFDRVGGSMPLVLPQCAAAIRIRWNRSDAGEHTLLLDCQDLRGIPLLPPLESKLQVPPMPDGMDSHAMNLVLNLQRLRIDREGKYIMRLRINNQELGAIPLYAMDTTPREPNPLER